MLQRQPPAGCSHEGTAGRDDGPQPSSHQGLVPEQTLQGQEESDPHEAAVATGEGQ